MAPKMMTWLKVFLFLGGLILLVWGSFMVMYQINIMNELKEKEMIIRCLEIYSDKEPYPEQECEKLFKKMRYN